MVTASDVLRQRKRRKVTLIFLAVLFSVSLLIYTWLGGFKKTAVSEVKTTGYLIVGQEYEGRSDGQQLGNLFSQMKKLNTEGSLPGTLVAVYYNRKETKRDSVKTFVGVIVRDSSVALPKGASFRHFPGSKAIRAEIFAHFLVAPAPGKVQEEMTVRAKQSGFQPQPYLVEKYYSPRNIVLELPVRE